MQIWYNGINIIDNNNIMQETVGVLPADKLISGPVGCSE